jgi:hypothetical protein
LDFGVDALVHVDDGLFGLMKSGIETIDGMLVEGSAVEASQEIGIDFGGIERVSELMHVFANFR